MLDQNTDRMWYVIGAVIVGAAIIFLVNSSFPQLFASVGATFEDKVVDVSGVIEGILPTENYGEITEIQRYEKLTLTTWSNSTIKQTVGQSFPEIGSTNANRIEGTGGDTSIAGAQTLISNTSQVKGRHYVYTISVKNIGVNALTIYDNKATYEVVKPGETRHLTFRSHGSGVTTGGHLQIQFRTTNSKTDAIKALVGPMVLGYYPDKGGN